MADNSASGSLTAAWDGITPATPPAGSIVLLAPGRDSTVGVDVRGTFSATVLLEVSLDGLNWAAPAVTTLTGAGASATITTPGTRLVSVSGAALLRARCSAYTSGTAVVVMAGTPGGGGAGGSGGGGGAATIADGADVAEGTTTDNAIQITTTGATPATGIGLWRGVVNLLVSLISKLPAALVGGRLDVNVGASATVPVTGTFFQGTQPVSGTVTANVGTSGSLALDATLTGRFPAAAASADTTANPTVSQIEVFPMVWNGTTWDRPRDMAAAQAATVFTGVPAVAPMYLDTTGTPSVRRGVTAASTTTGVTGTQVPASASQVWDATNFRPQLGDTSGRTVTVGAGAAGAAIAGNPVLIAGSDATNARALLTDTSGRPIVVGAAAAGAAVAGNPVLLGVSDGTNAQTWRQVTSADGQQVGVPGVAALGRANSTTWNAYAVGGADGDGATRFYPVVPELFNGSTVDRQRSNVDVTLLASAARTTTQTSADITTYNCQAIVVTLDVTATVSTVSLTVVIRYKDPASGKYIALLTGTAVAATGTTTYCVDPRLTAGTPPYTKTVPANLGRVLQLEVTVGNANSQTYSLGYTLIPG